MAKGRQGGDVVRRRLNVLQRLFEWAPGADRDSLTEDFWQDLSLELQDLEFEVRDLSDHRTGGA